ncbi:MAG TPA: glycosyltransferase, partial [Chloroflexi bacterium]|nr:glycosyltransferase [Chloroflexota bacterium]
MSDPEYAVKLSVVLPIFNEIGSLSELDRQLSEAITSLGFPCEVVCVDDGSTDGSWARLQELSSSNPMYRMVKLRRNYGQSAALAAGVDVARGEFI